MIFKEVVNNHPNKDNHECNVKSVEINGYQNTEEFMFNK